MKEFMYSFFDLISESCINFADFGFTAFMSNLTLFMICAVLLISLSRPVFSKLFRGGWRYALYIALPIAFILPLRCIFPVAKIPVIDPWQLPLRITSPPLEFTGISEGRIFAENKTPEIITVGDVFIWVWLAVFIFSAVFELYRLYMLDKRIKRRGRICKNPEYTDILKALCVKFRMKAPKMYIFPETDTPFAMGILRPRIILPSEDYSAEEMGFILRHELIHIKRGDIPVKLFMILFRAFNWYNPLAYVMCRQAFEDMEIACDEKAAEKLSEEERKKYSETILRGVTKGKYPAVTTYLSVNAKTLKKRISAVLDMKKLGGLIPFTLVFIMMFFIMGLFVPMKKSDYNGAFFYTIPFSLESDPYVTSEEWRTCEADDPDEAGRKIFSQYMDMYMGEDVPEYYRIEDYYIKSSYTIAKENYSKKYHSLYELLNSTDLYFRFRMGVADDSVYTGITYTAEFTNKCGNTAHDSILPIVTHFNGYDSYIVFGIEMKRDGNTYTAVNLGMTSMDTMIGVSHFDNAERSSFKYLDLMAKCSLLDYDWGTLDKNDFPRPEDVNTYDFLLFKEVNPDRDFYVNDVNILSSPSIGHAYLMNDERADKETRIISSVDGYPFRDAEFVYCGSDFNCETLEMTSYGNVTGENPHGVILKFDAKSDGKHAPFMNGLVSVTVTDELFEPVVYRDSFQIIPLPESMKENISEDGAREILEYMKTPRDGTDFTVLDYKNISEENGHYFAEVKYKGRLDGIYASDSKKTDPITKEYLAPEYVKTKIV